MIAKLLRKLIKMNKKILKKDIFDKNYLKIIRVFEIF